MWEYVSETLVAGIHSAWKPRSRNLFGVGGWLAFVSRGCRIRCGYRRRERKVRRRGFLFAGC